MVVILLLFLSGLYALLVYLEKNLLPMRNQMEKYLKKKNRGK